MEDNYKVPEENSEMYQLLHDAMLLLGFVWRAIKRHRWLATLVFISIVGLSIALLTIVPKTYDSNARILTHMSRTILGIVPSEGRRSAAELIRSRENLTAVIKETNLITRWKKSRTTAERAKDRIFSYLFGELSDKEFSDLLVLILRNKTSVDVNDYMIRISAEWQDAETAYALVDCLVRRFMEDQNNMELVGYYNNISIYEKKLKLSEGNLNRISKNMKDQHTYVVSTEAPEISAHPLRVKQPTKSEPSLPVNNEDMEPEIDELARALSLKKQEIKNLENTYFQRLGEAKNKLSELQLSMGPKHPDVIKAERYATILSTPPKALEDLRIEQEKLSYELETAKNRVVTAVPTAIRKSRKTMSTSRVMSQKTENREKEDLKFDEYRSAILARNKIEEELVNAGIELDSAKTALQYRFKVTQPPDIAKAPIKPNPPKIIMAAVFAGLFLGIFLSVFIDIKAGIILEGWQISRILRIPVFGEMDEP